MSNWPTKIDDDFGRIAADGKPHKPYQPEDWVFVPPNLKTKSRAELVNDLWDTLVPAWLGTAFGVWAILVAAIFGLYFEMGIVFSLILVACGVGLLCCSVPWHRVHGELKRRRRDRDRHPNGPRP